MVIDLRQLTFLDSTGIAALVAADSYARRDGRTLTIVKGPPQVQRVLELCGLTEVLPFADEPVRSGRSRLAGWMPMLSL